MVKKKKKKKFLFWNKNVKKKKKKKKQEKLETSNPFHGIEPIPSERISNDMLSSAACSSEGKPIATKLVVYAKIKQKTNGKNCAKENKEKGPEKPQESNRDYSYSSSLFFFLFGR